MALKNRTGVACLDYGYYDYYDYGYDFLMTFIGVFAVIMLVVIGVSLVMYIFESLGLYHLAKNRGLANPWMAWVPFARIYMMGAITDDINRYESKGSNYRFILLGGSILLNIISYIIIFALWGSIFSYAFRYGYGYEPGMMVAFLPLVNIFLSLLNIAYTVVYLIALNKIFQCYSPRNSTLYTVLCVFFGFLRPIFLFTIRNNQPRWVAPPQQAYYPGQGGYAPPQGPNQPGAWQQQSPPYQQQGGYAPPPYQPAPPRPASPERTIQPQRPVEPPVQPVAPPPAPYQQPVTPPPADPQNTAESHVYGGPTLSDYRSVEPDYPPDPPQPRPEEPPYEGPDR
ncbi:MAG: hypothetical protein LBV27_07175 [Oscillospiraceae bacterium]|jgi:hypothetical protein|nr:hypothetical protein [Oscillospiraceae bacterium]